MNVHAVKKEYTNGEVTVLWQAALCIHAGVCVKNLASVFEPQAKPWIQLENAITDGIIATIQKCPSGALSIVTNKA